MARATYQVSRQQERAIAKAFLAAASQTQDSIDSRKLYAAIEARDLPAILEALGVTNFDIETYADQLSDSFRDELNTVYFDTVLAIIAGLGIRDAILNPLRHSQHFDELAASLVATVTTGSASALVNVLGSALKLSPALPTDTIAAILRGSIGLTATQAASLVAFSGVLALAVGKGWVGISPLQARFLNASQRSTLNKAMRDGILDEPRTVRTLLERQATQLATQRATSLATTQATRFSTRAAAEAISQAIQAGKINQGAARKYLQTAGDEKVRASHEAAAAMNPTGRAVDEDFSSPFGDGAPPWEVNCRCSVVYVTDGSTP
jgi:hypothetical protein